MFEFLKKEEFKIVAVIDGELISISDVPDQMFSEKLMGDGYAIIPSGREVVAPIAGVVESVFPTGHAVGIRSKSGVECIIHVGLDTVELNGEGFCAQVKQGDKVKAGDSIILFDKELLEEKGYNQTVMVVFPSGYDHEFDVTQRNVKAKEELVS